MSSYPMTVEGKEMLDQELNHLIKVEREKLKIEISEARELGDLKENAEYHAAKEKQSIIEGRIAELQSKLARATVVDVTQVDSERVVFGAIVTLYDPEKDESLTYQIVGEDEAATDKSKISYNSPLGKAMIGKEEGDEVIVRAPKGDISYEVESFHFAK